jgi:hypothetical protein
MERKKLHHMYQRARTHEMIMQRLLPEVPRFKTDTIFAKDSETADSKLEEEHSHPELREQSHEAPVSQHPRLTSSPPVKVDHSTSQLLRDSDHDMLKFNGERSPPTATSSSKAGSVHADDGDVNNIMADRTYKPVLVPLTMDVAMNKFPVRVSCVIVYSLQESKCRSALWTNYLMAKEQPLASVLL